jgi:hypothetical protein
MAPGVFTHFYSPFWDPGTLMVQRSNPVACRSNSCQPSVIGPDLGSSPTACQSSLMLCAQNKKGKKLLPMMTIIIVFFSETTSWWTECWPTYQCFLLFSANFRNLTTKKKSPGESNKGVFEIQKKTFAIS